MFNDYINRIVPKGSEDRRYNCECKIIADDPLRCVDHIGFYLSGEQIRDLWCGLSRGRHDWNIEFDFNAEEDVTLRILTRYKSCADYYMQALGAPLLFEGNDKV